MTDNFENKVAVDGPVVNEGELEPGLGALARQKRIDDDRGSVGEEGNALGRQAGLMDRVHHTRSEAGHRSPTSKAPGTEALDLGRGSEVRRGRFRFFGSYVAERSRLFVILVIDQIGERGRGASTSAGAARGLPADVGRNPHSASPREFFFVSSLYAPRIMSPHVRPVQAGFSEFSEPGVVSAFSVLMHCSVIERPRGLVCRRRGIARETSNNGGPVR